MKTLGDVAVAAMKKKKKKKKKEEEEEEEEEAAAGGTSPSSSAKVRASGGDEGVAPPGRSSPVQRTGSSGSVKLKAAVFDSVPALVVKTPLRKTSDVDGPSSPKKSPKGAATAGPTGAAKKPATSEKQKEGPPPPPPPPAADDTAATIEALTTSMESVMILLDEQNRDFTKRLKKFQHIVEENDDKVRTTCGLLEDKLDVIAGMQREMVRMREEDRAQFELEEQRREKEMEELREKERLREEEEATIAMQREREVEKKAAEAEGKPVVSRMRRELFVNTRARLLPPDPREWKVHHVSVWADSLFTGELDDSYTTGIKTAVGRDGDLHRDEAQMENESDSVFDAGAKLRVHLVNGRALLEVEDIFEKVGVQRVGQLFALKTARSALMLQIGIESSSNGHSVGQHGSELEEYGHKDGGSGGGGKEEEDTSSRQTSSQKPT